MAEVMALKIMAHDGRSKIMAHDGRTDGNESKRGN